MSVVIAARDGDKIIMGADCQVSYGGSKAVLTSPHLKKVWELEGHPNTLMGGVGALRDLNIGFSLEHIYDPMRDKANEPLDFKFVVNQVVPFLLNHFTEMGRTIQNNGIITFNGSSFLLAQKDKCYQIDADGCVLDLSCDGEIMAIGSGSIVAEAAYKALADTNLTVEEKVLKALIQAAEQDLHVNFPVYVQNTDDTDRFVLCDGEEIYVFDDTEEVCEEVLEEDEDGEELQEQQKEEPKTKAKEKKIASVVEVSADELEI